MRVLHQVPVRESRRHERTLDCPCHPTQCVTAAPGEQPAVTITHYPIPKKRTR